MAFDGIVISNIVNELNNCLIGGRLYKIAQTEKDELFITIKTQNGQYRLLISVNASLPLIYLTKNNKTAPLTAPNFCMLLRKHINNGRIISITQHGLERIIRFEIEHLDEMGDTCRKYLIVELMGKHSNIIFSDIDNNIIDSIKHISANVSSVREVLPGRQYFIPNTEDKLDPESIDRTAFSDKVFSSPASLSKALYTSITGISPLIANEICNLASIDPRRTSDDLTDIEKEHFTNMFFSLMDDVKASEYRPNIIYDNDCPFEFSSLELSMYDSYEKKYFESISELLETYYAEKNNRSRINQRSSDLRTVINSALERNYKKYDLQLKQLRDTDKRDKYKVYGELINTYGYNIPEGSKSFKALNYYTNEEIDIPLDKDLTPRENSIKYFERYNKLKRTYDALSVLCEETKADIEHLESVSTSLDIAGDYEDLVQIREELIMSGYIRKRPQTGKQPKIKSKPYHYVSSDGFDIYVGKNNIQNDELTFKTASNSDWWFHAKDMPGSHVIVKCEGQEISDKTYEECARLAAFYSKGRNQEKVDVDYSLKKNIKKPNSAKPGFVIYHTNYSMTISPDISGIKQLS